VWCALAVRVEVLAEGTAAYLLHHAAGLIEHVVFGHAPRSHLDGIVAGLHAGVGAGDPPPPCCLHVALHLEKPGV